jgi:hypothetical protein
MAARQLRDPITFLIAVDAGDRSVHHEPKVSP